LVQLVTVGGVPANDISKSSFNIPRIRKTMAGAHEVLVAVALTRSRILISKARGEYTNLRGRAREDDAQSILGSVMGVTQEVNNAKRSCHSLPNMFLFRRSIIAGW
jgi:non-canonical poly(A) RNA polymerase PAPD5/7